MNKVLQDTRSLFILEWKLEWKQKAALGSIFIYLLSTLFVVYLSVKRVVDIPTWNALFWLVIIFAAANGVNRSFATHTKGKLLYLYSLVSAESFILSRILYNAIIISLLSLGCIVFYTLVLENPIQNPGLFILNAVIGSIGFSSILTLINAIAMHTKNSASMSVILGFPLILPLLMITLRLSKQAIDGLSFASYSKFLLSAGLLDIVILVLAMLLFPYLWRD